MIQVFDRPTGNEMKFVSDSTKISRSSQAGINEGQGEHVVLSVQVRVEPWSFQLEVDFIGPEHAIVLHAVEQRVPERKSPGEPLILPDHLRHRQQQAKDLGLARSRDRQRDWTLPPPGAGFTMPVVIVRPLVAGGSATSTSRRTFERWLVQHAATRRTEQIALPFSVENGDPLLDLAGRWWPSLVEPADFLILRQSKSPAGPDRPPSHDVTIPLWVGPDQIPLGETLFLVEDGVLVPDGDKSGELVRGVGFPWRREATSGTLGLIRVVSETTGSAYAIRPGRTLAPGVPR